MARQAVRPPLRRRFRRRPQTLRLGHSCIPPSLAGSLRNCTVAVSTLIGASPAAIVDQELVEHVGLVVEIEAAIGRAGNRPHQIPRKRFLAGRGDLGSLPGTQRMQNQGSVERFIVEVPIASSATCDYFKPPVVQRHARQSSAAMRRHGSV
jgi:hypothetical protein